MTTPSDLERLCRTSPPCAGIAWFAGSPLVLIAATGEPAGADGPSWHAIAQAAGTLLRDGPIATPEVLLRLPTTLVLLAERPTGVVAVAVPVNGANTGVALVQARMAASQVDV